jgi:hypothetical protein
MENGPVKQARWLAAALLDRLGWQGAAGLALMAAWAAFCVTQLYPVERKLGELRAGLAKGGGTAVRSADARKELEAFRTSLRQGTLESQLKELNESGKAAGLAFKRIDYRMLEERRSGLRQYQITMPVSSTYPDIRRFTSLALASMPGLSLDHVHFQRRRIGDAAIDAELRFTLFLAEPA